LDRLTLDALVGTAAFVGFFHTVTGPDHFVPFIAMSRAGKWSLPRTAAVTVACGIGHVAGSVLLGLAGLAIGTAVAGLEAFEGLRGDVAGWLLLSFGLAYLVWGLRRAWRNAPHKHVHVHADGTLHVDSHTHGEASATTDAESTAANAWTPWILFLVFVFGPCEPLIPLLMYPAAEESMAGAMLVAGVFCATTLGTMLSIVVLGYLGFSTWTAGSFERYAHAGCGAAIALCGAAVCYGL
jgi:sulfite exporter TauE/SafE